MVNVYFSNDILNVKKCFWILGHQYISQNGHFYNCNIKTNLLFVKNKGNISLETCESCKQTRVVNAHLFVYLMSNSLRKYSYNFNQR